MRKGQHDSRIDEYEDRGNVPTRGQTMGMMSGMTAGSNTLGNTVSGAGTYSGMRSSAGKGSHSMRPAHNIKSGMDAYQSTGGDTRMNYPQLMQV